MARNEAIHEEAPPPRNGPTLSGKRFDLVKTRNPGAKNHASSISALTPRSASGVSTSMSAPLPVTGTSTTASP